MTNLLPRTYGPIENTVIFKDPFGIPMIYCLLPVESFDILFVNGRLCRCY